MMGFLTVVLRSEFVSLTREVGGCRTNLSTQKIRLGLDMIIVYKVNGHYALKHTYTSLQQEIMNAIVVKKEEIEAVIDSWNSAKKS